MSSRGTASRSTKRGSQRGSRGSTRMGGSRVILGDGHEKTQQYRSKNGRAYIQDKTQKTLDQSILRMGKGAAFVITPASGRLPPWGSVTVDIVSYNDMPGSYRDELLSNVVGLPPASLRTKMKVVGTTLSLSTACVGLDQSSTPPIFAWGNLLRSAAETSRYLKVVNTGPIPCKLTWKMKGIYAEPPLLDIALEATDDDEMPVNMILEHHPPNPPPPFTVFPEDATIPAYGETPFEVTFVPPDSCDSYKAIMHADASYDFSDHSKSRVGDKSTTSPISGEQDGSADSEASGDKAGSSS